MTYNRRPKRKSDYEPSKALTAEIQRAVEERQARALVTMIQCKHNWLEFCDYCLASAQPENRR